jgi:hypothetical protein
MSEVLAARTIRIMWMTDEFRGHITWGWDAEHDPWVLPLIRRRMDEGYVFWIVRRNPLREVQLRRVEDIGENRTIIIQGDELARELFEQGRIGLVTETGDEDLEAIRPARTPEEVVANDTVAHRPLGRG